MKCSNCGKNNANVSFNQNINGEVTNLHLCEECAHKLGIFNSFDDIFSPTISFSISSNNSSLASRVIVTSELSVSRDDIYVF